MDNHNDISTPPAPKKRTARGSKATTERRRRNTDSLSGKRRRLNLQEDKLDRENFTYRWANDDGNRIYDLTVNDDWEVVGSREGMNNTADLGAGVQVRAGTSSTNKAMNAILLRKPKEYHDEDLRRAQQQIDKMEAQELKPSAQDDNTYSPPGGTQITSSV